MGDSRKWGLEVDTFFHQHISYIFEFLNFHLYISTEFHGILAVLLYFLVHAYAKDTFLDTKGTCTCSTYAMPSWLHGMLICTYAGRNMCTK